MRHLDFIEGNDVSSFSFDNSPSGRRPADSIERSTIIGDLGIRHGQKSIVAWIGRINSDLLAQPQPSKYVPKTFGTPSIRAKV